MNRAETSDKTPILARKGMAAPAGLVVAQAALVPAAKSTAPPVSAPDGKEQSAGDSRPATATADAAVEMPPAASLLPLDFAVAKFREAETENLLRLEPAGSVPSGAGNTAPLQVEPRPESTPAARTRTGIGFGALAAAIAVIAIAGFAVWRLSAPQPGPVALPGAPTMPERAAEAASAATQAEADDASSNVAAAPAAETPEAAVQPAIERIDRMPDASAEAADRMPAGKMPQSAAAITPSVDIVDLQPDGSVVIAGRAAPESELIVLDGDEPIGTVKADAGGEWVLVPDRPLPLGEHAFGLVIKEVHGTVVLPAPESKLPPPVEPATQREKQSLAPLPPRKPKRIAAAADPAFVVQLASVKTRDGAVQEWEKLKTRFPDLLAGKKLSLDEAEVQGRGLMVRVRAGPFSDHDGAADFCANIAAGRQDCLVVRTGS